MNKKKKILHTMTWLAKGGGVDHNVFITLDGLKEDFELHLAVGNEIHHNPFINLPGIKFIQCNNLVRRINLMKDLHALFFFIRLIRREKYDIIHTHEAKASLITRLAAHLAGCKFIIYGLHGVTFNDPMSRLKRSLYIFVEKITIGVSDLIIGVSKDVIRHYHENRIGTAIPWKVIHSGIDIEKFLIDAVKNESERTALRKKIGIKPDDLVLINIGRFSFSKGQRYSIESFALLKNKFSHLKLLLVGEGELMKECQQLVRELKLENEVIFYGFCDTIATLLSISDIHLLTSLREGLPRVSVEASLMKIPTVAFDVEGIREVITDNENGFITPPYNKTIFVEKLEELILNKEKREIFGTLACRHVSADWDATVMLQQLRSIYTTHSVN